MNEDHLRRYARLLVEHGVSLRRGQPLFAYGQVAHRRLLAMLTEVAYAAGSGAVETRAFDPLQVAALIRHGRAADAELHHVQDAGWAQQVFPELAEAAAYDRLAELIFRFASTDREDVGEQAAAKDRRLKARCRRLDELEVREIHLSGGGTDLVVGLPREARWIGGSLETAAGQRFCRNLPSEEVFTTPDRRLTEGRLAASRPLRLDAGTLVSGLVLQFENGRVVDFTAESGQEAFGRWLELEDGARALGELALVGEDSEIAKSGLFFDLELLDENASSHAALGRGYAAALAGGEGMSPRELAALGFNPASVHLDVLFGSPEVRVAAITSREGEVLLIEQGRWAEQLSPE